MPASSAARASVSVPAWFGLTSTALHAWSSAARSTRGRARRQVVVADDLHARADRLVEADPRDAVVLAERVLDRHDRVAADPVDQHRRKRIAVELAPVERELVGAVAAELGGRDVERDRDVASRAAARPARSRARACRAPPRSTRSRASSRPRRRRRRPCRLPASARPPRGTPRRRSRSRRRTSTRRPASP